MMDTLREDLELYLGGAYNDQTTMNRYGSANGLIDEMIRIIFTLVEKRIEEKIHVMRGTKYNNGMSTVFYKIDALEEFKKELLTE